jgi:hypothetical protein
MKRHFNGSWGCTIISMLGDVTSKDREPGKAHGPYRRLTITGDVYIGDMVTLVPEAILHRYIAITS